MKLYGYFRSSAAFRVRIALYLKGLAPDTELVNLQAGDQSSAAYRTINPQGRVPSLEDDGAVLVQSMAIMEYLDEIYPDPPLLPVAAKGRARVRGIANIIACDIHPLNNLAILNYIKAEFGADTDAVNGWYRHWVKQGFDGIESILAGSPETGTFCHGDVLGLADICLVPQVFNAQRFDSDLSGYPTILRINDACMKLDAVERALPGNQPEAAGIA